MDQYFKAQVKKRGRGIGIGIGIGITIIQSTYTGIDTEFEKIETVAQKFKNRLISVQTAIHSRTLVKIPLYHPCDISSEHLLTSAVSNTYKNKVDKCNPLLHFSDLYSKTKNKKN